MRLIHAQTLQLREFLDNAIPSYAIVSHTWQDDEVTFQDMVRGQAESKAGYAKIRSSCQQALHDKIKYVWVDTCCIDKTSSAELSEAINSMYRWYKDSKICYAYLSDVDVDDRKPSTSWKKDFPRSRWLTRGWTLQELLAPKDLHFFSKQWIFMGTKLDLCDVISEAASIDAAFLRGEDLVVASIAERMSWAANRQTTRIEDAAYSLLGIFDVNMPLLYGEGEKAFGRLQEEILKLSEDQTIFAWGTTATVDEVFKAPRTRKYCGPLARAPKEFANSSNIMPSTFWQLREPYAMTNKGLQITTNVVKNPEMYGFEDIGSDVLALIGSQYKGKSASVLAIRLAQMPSSDDEDYPVNEYIRVGPGMPVELPLFPSREGRNLALELEQRMIYIKLRPVQRKKVNTIFTGFILPPLPDERIPLTVTDVFPADYWSVTAGAICKPVEASEPGPRDKLEAWGAVITLSGIQKADTHANAGDEQALEKPEERLQAYLFLRCEGTTDLHWDHHLIPKPADWSLKELYDDWVERNVLPIPRSVTTYGSSMAVGVNRLIVNGSSISVGLNKISSKGFDAVLINFYTSTNTFPLHS